MPHALIQLLPIEGIKIILVLFLSFLIGIEREEHNIDAAHGKYSFGGVRTFPLIGLLGYAMAVLSSDQPTSQLAPIIVGFVAIAAFLWLSYKQKIEKHAQAGVTTEMSGLVIYVVGALISRGQFWIGTTLAILCMLLLELKTMLENLSRRLPEDEILTFTKFLLLTAVILPVVPNRTFGSFGVNPFTTWLIVVAASGISYGSYLLRKFAGGNDSVFLSAVLGGAYSSTVTTVVLAKRAKEAKANASHLWAGGILMASGAMYFRLLILVGLFNRGLMARLFLPFLLLGALALVCGWLWSRVPNGSRPDHPTDISVKNPLEISAAFVFAMIFVIMLAATHYAVLYFGRGGVYGLAALTGFTDIDPFILGLTQSAGAATPLGIAVAAIIIAAASNNIVKGFYAFCFADHKTGIQALALLLALAAMGLLPLAFLNK